MAAKAEIFCEYFNMGAGKCKCPGYVENPSKWSKGKCKRCTHDKSKHNIAGDNDEAPKEEAKKEPEPQYEEPPKEPEPQYEEPAEEEEQPQQEEEEEAGGGDGGNNEEQGGDYGDQ